MLPKVRFKRSVCLYIAKVGIVRGWITSESKSKGEALVLGKVFCHFSKERGSFLRMMKVPPCRVKKRERECVCVCSINGQSTSGFPFRVLCVCMCKRKREGGRVKTTYLVSKTGITTSNFSFQSCFDT